MVQKRQAPSHNASIEQQLTSESRDSVGAMVKKNTKNHDIGTVLVRDGSYDQHSSIYNSGWLASANIIDYCNVSPGKTKLFNQSSAAGLTGEMNSQSSSSHFKMNRFSYKGV